MAQNNKNGKIYVGHINIRQSIFFLVLKLMLMDIFASILALVYFFSVSNQFTPSILSNTILMYNVWFFMILIVIKFTLTIYVVLGWINEYYEIWPTFIIHKRGFIIKNQEKHPLSHLRSIKVEQGVLGKFFGYGTITIYNWYLERHTSLYLIHNPIKYYNIIESLIPRTEEEKHTFQDAEG